MKLYRTTEGAVVEASAGAFALPGLDWTNIFRESDAIGFITKKIAGAKPLSGGFTPIAPITTQEVWATDVTYYRSRDACMEESKDAGGGDFYSRVYDAVRPELFFKSPSHRVAGPGTQVRIRKDSKWNVPEPELTLAINTAGKIIGYTFGNDMSSRDIEGENRLYLSQAKSYDQAAGLGPCIFHTNEPLPTTTVIRIIISRSGKEMFNGATALDQLKRNPAELVEFLYRESTFADGSFLMTGTGIVPPNEFTLLPGDTITITIGQIGALENIVAPLR